MRVQSITSSQRPLNPVKRAGKVHGASNTTFKSYESLLHNIATKKLENSIKVSRAFQKLYASLEKEGKVVDSTAKRVLYDFNAYTDTQGFLCKIGKPIREMESRLRDLCIKADNGEVVILNKGADNELALRNYGKHGFFNTIFGIESAKQDVRLVFSSGNSCIEFGVKKDGGYYIEQSNGNYWAHTKYSPVLGRIESHDTGNASDRITGFVP